MTAVARAVPEERRSKMLGLVSAGGSLGTLMVPLTTQSLLASHAWQIGALFFVALAALMIPAGFLAGGVDKIPAGGGARVSMRETVGQAMRHRRFLVMSGAYFVCGLNLVFLGTHLPAYLALCGQDPMLSAEAIAVIGGVNCFGSLAAGWLGARYPKHILLGLLYILRAFVFTAYFIMPPTPTTTLLFAAAMGMLWLSVAPLVSGLVAEMFGTRYMATLLGISFVMHQVGSSLGAYGGGLIFDTIGSYDYAWRIGVLIGFTAGVVQIVAGGPARRRDPKPRAGAGADVSAAPRSRGAACRDGHCGRVAAKQSRSRAERVDFALSRRASAICSAAAANWRPISRPAPPQHDRDASHPIENYRRLREEGFLALNVPKKWGGAGVGLLGPYDRVRGAGAGLSLDRARLQHACLGRDAGARKRRGRGRGQGAHRRSGRAAGKADRRQFFRARPYLADRRAAA